VQIANTAMAFIMNLVTTVTGWFSSFFGTVIPGGSATDDKKSQFMKYGLIIVALFFAAKIFRINIGGKGRK